MDPVKEGSMIERSRAINAQSPICEASALIFNRRHPLRGMAMSSTPLHCGCCQLPYGLFDRKQGLLRVRGWLGGAPGRSRTRTGEPGWLSAGLAPSLFLWPRSLMSLLGSILTEPRESLKETVRSFPRASSGLFLGTGR